MRETHLTSVLRRVPAGLEDVSKYVDLFSALYASGQWSVQVGSQVSICLIDLPYIYLNRIIFIKYINIL